MGYYHHVTAIHFITIVPTLVAEGAELNPPTGVKKWQLQLLVGITGYYYLNG